MAAREECSNSLPVRRLEGDVDLAVGLTGRERPQPERRPASDAVADDIAELHHAVATQGRERGVVERGARSHVTALDGQMIEHDGDRTAAQ